jgi:hypothetical protein
MRCWGLFCLLVLLASAARSAETPSVPDLRGLWVGTVQRARKQVTIEVDLRHQGALRRERRLHVDLLRGRIRGFGFHNDELQATADSRRRFTADATEEDPDEGDHAVYFSRATVSPDGNTITGRFTRWARTEDTEGTADWKQDARGKFSITRTGAIVEEPAD